MKIIVKTLEGLEEILADELEDLQVNNITKLRRAVECEANISQLYKCNYLLRTALRVLVPIGSFECTNEDELYEAAKSINWSQYLSVKDTLAIDATVSGKTFTHSRYAIYKTKDAITDQFSENFGSRPNVDPKNPKLRIDLHIAGRRVNIALDSSGQSLHLRNYKYRSYKAPLNEVLAAGLILLTGWDKKQTFQDPMCGSGTLITEALSIAGNIPPGMFIPKFGFESWPDFQPEMWKFIKEAAIANITTPEADIIGSDIFALAIRDVKKNLQKFPFRERVRLYQRDFFRVHGHPGRLLIMNPPYDKRVQLTDVEEFYTNIGNALKTYWQGSTAWIFSGNPEAIKKIGLKTSRRLTLNNGGIVSKFHKFDLYDGSK